MNRREVRIRLGRRHELMGDLEGLQPRFHADAVRVADPFERVLHVVERGGVVRVALLHVVGEQAPARLADRVGEARPVQRVERILRPHALEEAERALVDLLLGGVVQRLGGGELFLERHDGGIGGGLVRLRLLERALGLGLRALRRSQVRLRGLQGGLRGRKLAGCARHGAARLVDGALLGGDVFQGVIVVRIGARQRRLRLVERVLVRLHARERGVVGRLGVRHRADELGDRRAVNARFGRDDLECSRSRACIVAFAGCRDARDADVDVVRIRKLVVLACDERLSIQLNRRRRPQLLAGVCLIWNADFRRR